MQHDLPMSRRAVPTSAPTSSIAAASEALLTPPCTSMDAARLMLSLVPKAAPAPRPASNARPPGATARSWGSEVGLLFPQPMLTGFRGGGAVAVSFNVRWRDEKGQEGRNPVLYPSKRCIFGTEYLSILAR